MRAHSRRFVLHTDLFLPMTGLRPHVRRASLPSFAAALLVPLILSACAKKQDRPQRQAVTVAVATAKRATVPYLIEANGVVTPLQTVALTPQVDGIIKSVDFEEGQEVQQGQPLFHIDARPYQNAYDQAVAVLARDSASWANAKVTADRYRQLLAAKVITPIEGEAQFTTAATAEATLGADRAAVAQARFNLDNTVIRAPIGGKTGSLLIRRGNLVHANSPVPLVVINQVRPIMVRFAIQSNQLGLVLQYGAQGGLPVAAVPGGVAPASPSIDSIAASQMNPIGDPPGQSGSSTRDGSGMSGSAAGVVQQGVLNGDRLMGKLSFIDNAVDTTTSTVQLKAVFDNSSGRLWTGEFATASLHLFDEDSVLVVPQQAIVTGQRGTYVYVIDKADTARQRAVVVERNAGGLAIVSNGLTDGEQVVIDGQARLTPDAPVRFRGVADAGPGGMGGGRRGRGRRGADGAAQGRNAGDSMQDTAKPRGRRGN